MADFSIPSDPTPADLVRLLSSCSNNIAKIADKCAEYKTNVAYKQTTLKREQAKALVRYSMAKNASIMKAQMEIDPDVVKAQDEYDTACATYQLMQAELDSYNSHFIALRKIVEMRKTEIQSMG